MTAAIAIEGLVKDYQGLRPLRIGRLSLEAGERIALSGLDATAAEVLVNLVNGAILPDQGDVRVFGRATTAIENEDDWLASLDRFGIVTPRAVLLEGCTVRQNLALPFSIDLEDPSEDVRARSEALAREAGLPADVLDVRAGETGPDTRMRIHLARALATDPGILLMEHPTAPMPREQVAAFAALTARITTARELTVLAITEDAAFADAVATMHYRLQGGTGALVNLRGWRRWF